MMVRFLNYNINIVRNRQHSTCLTKSFGIIASLTLFAYTFLHDLKKPVAPFSLSPSLSPSFSLFLSIHDTGYN